MPVSRKNPVLHDRNRHITPNFHIFWECAKKEELDVDFVKNLQLASIHTMALESCRFLEVRSIISGDDKIREVVIFLILSLCHVNFCIASSLFPLHS